MRRAARPGPFELDRDEVGAEETVEGPESGPYGGGTRIELAATVRASLTSAERERPRFGDLAITELAFGSDRVFPPGERTGVYSFLALFTHHLASYALNDGGPTLPVPSLETSAEFERYGVPAALELGAITPSVASRAPRAHRRLRRAPLTQLNRAFKARTQPPR